ncbi:MAG: cob(I)yrinic acid a,c-diamide adenosyltransferase [bacterium]|nr:cob(I)yrinic acid a,c-diamide adenosyltransferase [bacterium]
MPRITKVTTRTGDDGTTGLSSGRRVAKDSLRIEAYGTVDELNSVLGVALAEGLGEPLPALLRRIQNELFHLGSDLSMPGGDEESFPVPRIEQRHTDALETALDDLSQDLPALENFVLPGGSPGAARLNVARTICRRAERVAVRLSREEDLGPNVIRYLNRLSDLLFVAARFENRTRGVADVLWDSRS